jgi:predicted ribosomally synthesized peptide with SipW-like signal peptide
VRKTRKVAVILACLGLGVGLIGVGVRASFTDSAAATANIKVGQFGISISSTTPGAVVNGKTVTLNSSDIQSSAAGSAPLEFTITNSGTMPATVNVSGSSLSAPFSDQLGATSQVTIPAGGHQDYNGGIAWSELGNAQLGQSVSITYTVSASQ